MMKMVADTKEDCAAKVRRAAGEDLRAAWRVMGLSE